MSTAQPSPRRSWRTPLLAILATVIALSAAGCGQGAYSSSTRLYTAPANPLLSAASLLKANGQAGAAADLKAIASTPSGIWAAGAPNEMRRVSQAAQAAAKAHEIPVIVAYNLPNRDACGKFSATPAAGAYYEAWIRQLAAAIGSANAIVVVEPDGL